MSWLPSDLSNLRQWSLDQEVGNGEPYEASLIEGKPALRPLESYDSLRAPRGQRCEYYPGVNQSAQTAAVDLDVTDFSFCCWVKLETHGASRRIFGQNSGNRRWGIVQSYLIVGDIMVEVSDGVVVADVGTGVTRLGSWVHIAGVVNRTANTLSVYLNGSLVDSVDITAVGSLGIGSVPITWGGRVSDRYMNGWIRDLRIIPAVVSDFSGIMDGQPEGNELLFAPCNAETGLISYDASGNDRWAELMNVTQSQTHAIESTISNPANELGHTNRRNLLPHSLDICNGLAGVYNGWNWNRPSTVTPNVADPDGGNKAFTIQPQTSDDFSGSHRQGTFAEPWLLLAETGDRFLFTAKASSPVNLVVDGTGTPKADIGTDWTEIDVTLHTGSILLGGWNSWSGQEAITFYNLRWIRAAQTDDSPQEITAGIAAEGIVPRDESSPANDVLGDPLQHPGQCPYPVQVKTPCGTFDGVDDKVMITGNPWNTAADFSLSAFVELSANGNYPMIFSGDLTGAEFRFLSSTRLLEVSGLANTVTVDAEYALPTGQLAFVACNYRSSDSRVQLFIEGKLRAEGTIPDFATNVTNLQFGARGDLYWFPGKMADLRIHSAVIEDWASVMAGELSGSEVACWKFAEGSGLTVHNAVANNYHGSATGIVQQDYWANLLDRPRDHCLEYGGRNAAGTFIPGLLDGSACADGNPVELLAKQHGNPHSRLVMDAWSAPRLAPLNLPAESPPGELLRVPGEQRFRSEENAQPGVHGTPFADGDNRLFQVDATLTGADLDAAIAYIKREAITPPSFLAAWARDRNEIIQAPVMP